MLTAYNEDVQKYIEAPNKAAKNEIIKEVKETALANGIKYSIPSFIYLVSEVSVLSRQQN